VSPQLNNASQAGESTNRAAIPGLLWVFALTMFLSAFLLFQVQLIISKSMLPWFGGSAAVWTTASGARRDSHHAFGDRLAVFRPVDDRTFAATLVCSTRRRAYIPPVLLWVLPLALYLLSFILCFDHPRWYRREIFHPLFVLGILVLCASTVYAHRTVQVLEETQFYAWAIHSAELREQGGDLIGRSGECFLNGWGESDSRGDLFGLNANYKQPVR
jgi:hypothetical protein